MQSNEVEAVLLALSKTQEERDVDIARFSRPVGFGAEESGEDDVELVSTGKSILDRLLDRISDEVCASVKIREACEHGFHSDEAMILPLLDIVAAVLSGPAVFTATASIIAKGVGRICKNKWLPVE